MWAGELEWRGGGGRREMEGVRARKAMGTEKGDVRRDKNAKK